MVRLTGPSVGPGRLAVRDLAELSSYLEQALKRVAQVISREEPRGGRPSARALEELCRLYLVRWSDGSATAGFNVAEPPPDCVRFGRLGDTAVDLFLSGLSELSLPTLAEKRLPRGFSGKVLETCAALGKLLERGIDGITFGETAPGRRQPTITYNAWMREHLVAMAARHLGWTEVPEYLGVSIAGQTLPIRHALHHAGVGIPRRSESSFWRTVPLDKLAAEQVVAPISGLDELDAIWSEGDVFDDALAELLHDRLERRRRNEERTE